MAKKEMTQPRRKEYTWLIVVLFMILLIAGILYLDHSKNTSPEATPAIPSTASAFENPPFTPTPYDQIEQALALKEPQIFYFYSSKNSTCLKMQPLIDSLEMRLEEIQIRMIKVSLEENREVFDLFDVTGYPVMVVYQGKEIYRQILKLNDTPNALLSTIKEKLGIP
jgi:thiol-disulfide isomerase/thioredoxin